MWEEALKPLDAGAKVDMPQPPNEKTEVRGRSKIHNAHGHHSSCAIRRVDSSEKRKVSARARYLALYYGVRTGLESAGFASTVEIESKL